MEIFAAAAIALYAAHHVGDYWVQTDHQARHKGDVGREGVLQCLLHVIGYLLTQLTALALLVVVLEAPLPIGGTVAALAVSGVTHYLADRREHGIMFWLARRLPGKANFLELGVPRNVYVGCDEGCAHKLDNPSLGTGAWALDQAWHIFWGVFVAALIIAA